MIMHSKEQTTCRLSQQAMSVAAVLLEGIRDENLIARAVGLDVEEVRRIELANDLDVRKLAVAGLPKQFLFRLRKVVVCPRCGSRIFLVPCVSCQMTHVHPESRRNRGHEGRRQEA